MTDSQPRKPSPRRKKALVYEPGSERRQEVLAHAAACFANFGYRGTSMRAIADSTGMLAGSLYSHFDSKLQMLEELMTRFFMELLPRQRAAFDSEGTHAERLVRMVREVVDVCAAHREVVMVIEVDWHVVVDTPELSAVVGQGRENTAMFRSVLEEGVAAGEFRDDVNLDSIVRLIHSSIYGLLDRRFRMTGRGGKRVNDFAPEDVAHTLSVLLVGGLTSAPIHAS